MSNDDYRSDRGSNGRQADNRRSSAQGDYPSNRTRSGASGARTTGSRTAGNRAEGNGERSLSTNHTGNRPAAGSRTSAGSRSSEGSRTAVGNRSAAGSRTSAGSRSAEGSRTAVGSRQGREVSSRESGARGNGYSRQTMEGGHGGSSSNGGRKPRSNKKNSKKSIAIIIAELLVIAICLAAVYMIFIRTNINSITEVKVDEDEIQQNIADTVQDNTAMDGYWNIALFGVDSREGVLSQGTLSDSIIIASINQSTGEIKLCSVYRDTYLNMAGDDDSDYAKANHAYSYGGPQQAINMLNKNLDMDITDFVTVGFGGLSDIIDALGGVEISVEEDEIVHLNNYENKMAQELGKEYKEVTSAGTQTLTGLQATAYCRIRYTAGNDFARAARQREVIQAIMTKARAADTATLTDIANEVFDEMATSLELSNIIDLVGKISNYSIVGEDGFPQESLRATGKVDGESIVAPMDLEQNVVWLHEFLFDEADYAVSDTVKGYSDTIASKTSSLAK